MTNNNIIYTQSKTIMTSTPIWCRVIFGNRFNSNEVIICQLEPKHTGNHQGYYRKSGTLEEKNIELGLIEWK